MESLPAPLLVLPLTAVLTLLPLLLTQLGVRLEAVPRIVWL